MKIRKILLIFPPTRYRRGISDKLVTPPLGLAYLAAGLRNEFEVRLLDATVEGYPREKKIDRRTVQYGLDDREIGAEIARYSPDVVGVSCLFSSQFPAVREICRAAKELNPEIVTVGGGSHPTFLARECLGDRNLDYIILGEGESSFLELLRSLDGRGDIAAIDGLAFRADGQVRVNSKTRFVENLDALPFPARELLPLEEYFSVDYPHGITTLRKRNTTMITSRGCPGRCTFCPSTRYWGNRARARSPENVIREMENLKVEWAIEEIQFEDDNLTFERERARRIFQMMIDRKLHLRWATPNGVALWTLDEEFLDLMKASGCYELTLGIESGSPEVLRDTIHKPLDLKRSRALVRHMQRSGIRTCGYFIIGFPGETERQIQETLRLVEELRLDKYNVFIFNPLPGSEISESLQARGVIKEDLDFTDMSFYKSNVPLSELAPPALEKIVRKELWKSRYRFLKKSPVRFVQRYRRGVWVKVKHFFSAFRSRG